MPFLFRSALLPLWNAHSPLQVFSIPNTDPPGSDFTLPIAPFGDLVRQNNAFFVLKYFFHTNAVELRDVLL